MFACVYTPALAAFRAGQAAPDHHQPAPQPAGGPEDVRRSGRLSLLQTLPCAQFTPGLPHGCLRLHWHCR